MFDRLKERFNSIQKAFGWHSSGKHNDFRIGLENFIYCVIMQMNVEIAHNCSLEGFWIMHPQTLAPADMV